MDGVVLGGEPPARGVARSEHAADGDIRGLGVELGQLPEGRYLGAVDAERELPDARNGLNGEARSPSRPPRAALVVACVYSCTV